MAEGRQHNTHQVLVPGRGWWVRVRTVQLAPPCCPFQNAPKTPGRCAARPSRCPRGVRPGPASPVTQSCRASGRLPTVRGEPVRLVAVSPQVWPLRHTNAKEHVCLLRGKTRDGGIVNHSGRGAGRAQLAREVPRLGAPPEVAEVALQRPGPQPPPSTESADRSQGGRDQGAVPPPFWFWETETGAGARGAGAQAGRTRAAAVGHPRSAGTDAPRVCPGAPRSRGHAGAHTRPASGLEDTAHVRPAR